MDKLDGFLLQWQQSKPELDLMPLAVLGRIARVMAVFEQIRDNALAPHDLKYGEFDVLATLRRQGEPYTLTPSDLYRSLLLSSGAISKRLDKLEQAGLIDRTPDPADKRGWLVSLTLSGKEKLEAALQDHTRAQQDLLAKLPSEQQATLASLLRDWLKELEK